MRDNEKMVEWRKRLGISLEDFSELSGYSMSSLYWLEQGKTPPRTAAHIAGKQKSKDIPAAVWKRFKNVCAGVEMQIRDGKQFNWETLK